MKSNYSAWNIKVENLFKLKNPTEQLRFLVGFGVLAPSSHNSQPWSFEVTSNSSISIKPEISRFLHISDDKGRQMFISLGCALENILVAADYYGLENRIEYCPSLSDLPAVKIYLDFKPKHKIESARHDHLIFSISKRRTNRNKYENRLPETHSFWDYSFDQATSLGVQINFISHTESRSAIADIVLSAMGDAMADKEFRAELSEYVKSNYTFSGLGMPGFGMGIPGPLSLLVPTIIRYLNIYKLSRKQDEALLKEHTPMFGILSTQDDDPTNWIKAGQAYERIALEAERAGLKTAIMAAAIQIGNYYKELQKILGISERPQIFFRVGFCDKNVHPSPRLTVEQLEAEMEI